MCSLEADGTSKLELVGTRSETPISSLPFSFFMLCLGFFFFSSFPLWILGLEESTWYHGIGW